MTAWASALVALALTAQPHVVFRFQDERIAESSAIVARGDLVYTVNDSGDSARVFVVDRRSGATVGVTTYGADVQDVEALALGPGDRLWVGDIGDNAVARTHITVYELALPGTGDRSVTSTAYELVYRGGPRDAETLLVHPRTGRLYVVSKGLLGGTVYAAPARLRADRTNVLVPVASAPALVTDGAFLADGKHAVLRDYSDAIVLRGRGFDGLARFGLPAQEQGEGIAVVGEAVLVSSEGRYAPVERVAIPSSVLAAIAAGPPTPMATATPTGPPPADVQTQQPWGGRAVPVLLVAAWVILMASVVARLVRRRAG